MHHLEFALLVAALIFVLPFRWVWVFPLVSFAVLVATLGMTEFTDLVHRHWLSTAKIQFLFVVTMFSARYGLRTAREKWSARR